jgi:hypothetical protein
MSCIRNAVRFLAVGLFVVPLGCSGGGEAASEGSDSDVASESSSLRSFPPLPSSLLEVPEGNRLAFYNDAVGVQIYACQAVATGFAWVFQAPEASLFDRRGRVVIKHYAGPTWESVADGSKVVASKLQEFTDDPSAIPELLLQATPHPASGRMGPVTYIQRLETVGGRAPTTGCDAAHVGAIARVDYTATYFFYEKSPRCN